MESGVVIAKNGYPEKYAKGAEITGIAQAEQKDNVTVFHSGTKKEGAKLLSNGAEVCCHQLPYSARFFLQLSEYCTCMYLTKQYPELLFKN